MALDISFVSLKAYTIFLASHSKEKKDGVLKNDMENLRHERCIVNIKMLYLEI
jgi:hypothetical protein